MYMYMYICIYVYMYILQSTVRGGTYGREPRSKRSWSPGTTPSPCLVLGAGFRVRHLWFGV